MKWKLFLLFIVGSVSTCFSQVILTGVIKDKKGEPVFAANVYLKSNPQKGVSTDFEGNFRLQVVNLEDTLMVSYIGYETKKIAITSILLDKVLYNVSIK